MGKRGIIPQPTESAMLKGYYRPSKHGIVETKPKYEYLSEVPEPPENLNEHGIKFWHDMLFQLLKVKGLVMIPDLPAFQIMATKYQTIVECNELLKTQSKWIVDHNGNMKENPVLKTLENAEKIYLQIATNFGCMPSARNNLKPTVDLEEDKDPLANFSL